MKKLTQTEANELIRLAWLDVERYGKGTYRFGQSLWNLIPNEILFHNQDTPYACLSDADFFYEQNCDTVLEKFYKYYVED